MNFDYWLNEMAWFKTNSCNQGICQIDLRVEDWSKDPNFGKNIKIDFWKPITGKLNDKWFFTQGLGSDFQIVNRDPSEENPDIQKLPNGWEEYAVFYGPNDEMVKPGKYMRKYE